jgi:hypothetical protein
MSSRAKSTRSKKTSAPEPPPAADPSPMSAHPTPRPKGRARPAPTIEELKDRLVESYQETFDKCEAFKDDVVAASKTTITSSGNAFEKALVSSLPLPHNH